MPITGDRRCSDKAQPTEAGVASAESMRNARYSPITRKVVIGYLVLIAFSCTAIGYALLSLRDHLHRTEHLVDTQFEALTKLRDIRQNLLRQEKIESQLIVLHDPQFLALYERRCNEFAQMNQTFGKVSLPEDFTGLPASMAHYIQQTQELQEAFAENDWPLATTLSASQTKLLRNQLLATLTELRLRYQEGLSNDMRELVRHSSQAYRITLVITLIGILLSFPIALTVLANLHRSVKTLQKATREIAAGHFDTAIPIRSNDEFGELARDFSRMARQLTELEQLQLDANPLTRLPGNLAIDREIERRIAEGVPFAHLYIDLDNFKAYSDRYGYKAGSDVINQVGNILREAVSAHGQPDDLVGHIGGDDYVVLTSPQQAEGVAQAVIAAFEQLVPDLYDANDLAAGYVIGTDRLGIKRSFPLLTISIAISLSENFNPPSLLTISHNCATMKTHLKQLKGSNYLIDRRKQPS